MIGKFLKRRYSRFLFFAALLLSIVPLSALASSHHTATRAPATITSTVVEVIDPGQEWVDEAGIFHLRNLVQLEDITGAITGTATVTVNIDVFAPGECTEASCPAFVEAWGTVTIESEGGRWTGHWMQSRSDVPGEEYEFSAVAVRGSGAFAGQSFFGEFVEETEDSVTIEGVISTMAMPVQGLNLNVHLCFGEESAGGAYLGTGLLADSGQAEGFFVASGSPWTHTYNLASMVTLTDEHGSVTLAFVGGAQDLVATDEEFTGHGWGSFMIIEGTGEYADLYGQGRAVGTASTNTGCASGFGVTFSFIGEAHYN